VGGLRRLRRFRRLGRLLSRRLKRFGRLGLLSRRLRRLGRFGRLRLLSRRLVRQWTRVSSRFASPPPRFPTYIRLVYFHEYTERLGQVSIPHRCPYLLEHPPTCLIRTAYLPLKLQTGYAFLAIQKKMDGVKPFAKIGT
jgi:hypothetical protein